MTTWTADQLELCKKLYDEGYSSSMIAVQVGGVSRNAVIGQIHRKGWGRGDGRRKPLMAYASGARNGGPPREIKPRRKRAAPSTPQPDKPTHYLDAMEATELAADVSAFACTLEELTEHSCRWPLGDPGTEEFRFCGAKRFGDLPYCAAHCSRAFQGPRRPQTDAEKTEALRKRRATIAEQRKRAA
jgi:GcrA cell cycle regulator